MSDIVERLRSYHKDSAHGALHEAADEIERLRERCHELEQFVFTPEAKSIRAATIEECEVTISDVFASTSPRDYMMNGPGGILRRMIDALHVLKEQK